MKQKQNLLLLKDVDSLGRSGQVVAVKRGFARNFLIPKKMAMVADINTLRRQEKLQKERKVKAAVEKKEAEEAAKVIEKVTLSITVKVDPEGKLYGSVTQQDILDLFAKEGITLTKKNIDINKPIKKTGAIEIPILLVEDVKTKVILNIVGEKTKEAKTKEDNKKEAKAEETTENKEIEEKNEEK